MPERPDLEYVVPALDALLRGRTITAAALKKPVVLRLSVEGTLEAALVGRRFMGAARHLHFVNFALEPADLALVVSPMLAGRFLVTEPKRRLTADTALVLSLDDGNELRYRDDVQMGKVYVLPAAALDTIPGYRPAGLDVLDRKAFTAAAFRALAKKRRDQVKPFLMDKAALDSMGNAYADEVLFEARVHPKAMARSLDDDALGRLHGAIVTVLTHARDEIRRRRPPLDEKVRDFLKVRGRAGEPCPRCGTTLRSAGVHGHDAEFCPACQPDARGTGLVDWKRTPAKKPPEGT